MAADHNAANEGGIQTFTEAMKYFYDKVGNAFKPEPSDLSDFRPATPEEIAPELRRYAALKVIAAEIKKLEIERARLEDGCKHRVFSDTDGSMFDVRICAGCGAVDFI